MLELSDVTSDLQGGFPILLVGSGFSAPAANKDGLFLPTGGGLTALLHEKLGYTPKYTLDVVSREFITKFGENGLFSLLQERLTATIVQEYQKDIVGLPWRRIYTTNYDSVVEQALEDRRTKFVSINGAIQSVAEMPTDLLSVIHINGSLAKASFRDFNEALRLTKASYLTESFIESTWFSQFRRDISVASVILIVGYSASDIDIARILYSDPTLKSRIYFVETVDIDPVFQRELEQYGTVLTVGMAEFANAALSAPPPTSSTRTTLASFRRFELPTDLRPPTGDDILSLLLLGSYDLGIQAGADAENIKYAMHRQVVPDVVGRIESGERYFLLHSDLGNGKTIALAQLALSLKRKQYEIYELTNYDDQIEDDLYALSKMSNVVMFVEDVFRSARIVSKITTALPNFPIVMSTRSAIYELRSHRIEDIISSDYIVYDLNSLNETEAGELISLFDENGLWADLSVKSQPEKSDFISRTCNRQLRSVLIRLFESPHIRDRIVQAFREDIDNDSLTVICAALLLDVAGFTPDLFLLNQLTSIDVLKKGNKLNNAFSLEIFNARGGSIRVKSSIFGEFVLQNVMSPQFVLDILISVAKKCEAAKQGNSSLSRVFSDLQKEIIRFSFVDRIFARKKAGDSYKRLYDNLKELPSMARNPQFWLQYAIARLEDPNYKASLIHFRTAYSHAKSIRNYDTFQIDNHYARYILESRTKDPTYNDPFPAFVEAHGLLIKQARKEKGAYYPYRVAKNYLSFFRSRGGKFDADQRKVVKQSAKDILEEISIIPKTAQKYYVIDDCYRDLSELVKELDT